MELELNKERFACYRALPQLSGTHEETAETIVPDYLPDVARIMEASGCLFLRSRENLDGRVSVSGQLRMTLLYLAEDAQGLRSFSYTLPLEHTMDARLPDGAAELSLEGRLCASEVRLLNPRKLFTRAEVLLALTPYLPCTLTVCSGVAQQADFGIETLCEPRTLPMIRALREKDFTFSDEVLLSGTKSPIRELLRTSCALRLTDCRPLGNKLALKGTALLELLYVDETGALSRASSELPFSQLLDAPNDNAALSARASLRLTGLEARIGSDSEPDNARAVSIKLSLSAFAVLSEEREVSCVADLYSTSCELDAVSETVELSGEPELFPRETLVRERLETGAEVRSVLASDVTFTGASLSGSGSDGELRAQAHLRVLYLDENGTPLLSERRTELLVKTELPASDTLSVSAVSAGEIGTTLGADGVELRFPVLFTLSAARTPSYPCLVSLSAKPREDSAHDAPSLVLRAKRDGERLWDLAKQYRTSVAAIREANELPEDAPAPAGKLLLIPRCR